MKVALLTVGDELLAGDTENTNASWLARQLADRGVRVTRILTVPDDVGVVADAVREYAAAFDAVVVTGGLGGTPDDRTMEAVAAAFDRPLAVDEAARQDVEETVARFREANPDLDARVDVEAQSSLPAGSRPLLNGAGLSPGCVVANVYVFPGLPDEMREMFADVADEFDGDVVTRLFYTPEPESAVRESLAAARDRFDVAVGSYPTAPDRPNRVKLSGEDAERIEAAAAWLGERVELHADPEATGGWVEEPAESADGAAEPEGAAEE